MRARHHVDREYDFSVFYDTKYVLSPLQQLVQLSSGCVFGGEDPRLANCTFSWREVDILPGVKELKGRNLPRYCFLPFQFISGIVYGIFVGCLELDLVYSCTISAFRPLIFAGAFGSPLKNFMYEVLESFF